jgi:hypothetical protein
MKFSACVQLTEYGVRLNMNWILIMELMEGMKAKARCSLRLFRGALAQNKQSSDFPDHVCVHDKLSIGRSNM